MLLNIHPAYRSSLHSIQLLSVVHATRLKKFGMDAVLKPAISDLQKLASEVGTMCLYAEGSHIRKFVYILLQGIQLKLFDTDTVKTFYGCLVAFLGDTPAAGLVGGFKEGVRGSYRVCRTCMVTTHQLSTKV